MARARALAVGKLATLTDLAETDPGEATRRATRALGREGFLALLTVKAYGGKASGIDHRALVAAREGIAYGSAVAHSAFAVQGLGMVPLTIAGSNDQKREWLPKAARGTVIGGYGLTEPTAGSDVRRPIPSTPRSRSRTRCLRTSARRRCALRAWSRPSAPSTSHGPGGPRWRWT